MTLGILYHMPFWQTADGALWESEGSFARYVDSLAPYFDRVVLCVPVFDRPTSAKATAGQPPDSGSRVRAPNVTLAPLPYFPGPRQFYPMLPSIHSRLRAWVEQCDVVPGPGEMPGDKRAGDAAAYDSDFAMGVLAKRGIDAE